MSSNRSRRALKNTVRAQRSRANRVMFDALEDRRLFTLIPIAPLLGYPQLQADNPGIVSYAAGTGDNGSLHAGATTIAVLTSPTTFTFIQPSDRVAQGVDLDVQIKKSDGSFAGGVAGWDLEVRGKVTIDSQVYDGVLLVGEATQFGFADSGNSFDFRFTLDGGLLAGLPAYAGKDLGVVLNRTTVSGQTSPQPFPNLFNFNFGGGAKVFVGPIPTLSGPPLPASLAGVKYQDITGNGFSTDDTPLANVTINLFQDADNDGLLTAADGASIASVLTGADGSYKFENLPTPGRYFVQEGASTSYVQTAGPAYYTVTPAEGEDVTGLNFDNFKKIAVSGTKYNDLSGNGLSSDDQPLAGVTIQLIQGGNVVATTVTGADGKFSFSDLGPGTYSVQEVTPSGWTQTAGNAGYTLTANSGVNSTGNDFANFHNITIAGTKTQDITGNGFSADDTPLAGVTIQLIQAGNVIATTTTAADGSYSFPNLGPGTYSVQEVLPTGYVQTAGLASYTITAASGTDSSGNDFANFKKVTISGKKFTDITGNSFSTDDTPLAGVTIALYKDNSATPVATTVTAADGSYSFADLGPGTYFVQEVLPAGYLQTGGTAGYTVAATSGTDSSGNDFANFKLITICGTKYNDRTGNGITTDDTPLAGITINLYKDGSATPVATTVTGADGKFSFSDLGPGTYTVKEVTPSGWTQTVGTAGYTLTATSGLVSTGNNFANYKLTPAIDIEKYVKALTYTGGGEGLTPGFWKQTQHFYAWTSPYVPTGVSATNYNAVFGLTAAQEDPGLTLLAALGRGGGGKNALGRHAAAALLNAANPFVSYAYTTAQIIALVQSAYATGDFEHAKNLLAAQNELEADLSTPAPAPGYAPGYGADADTPGSGPVVTAGTELTFTFVVKNTGDTPLINVVVTDDRATADPSDDFHPAYVSGDVNNDGILDLNETWVYTWVTTALAGPHTNVATVTGDNVFNTAEHVTDSDAANYSTGDTTTQPSLTSIAGTKFLDVTGNGLSADDTPLSGVTIKLYKDVNGDGKLTSTDGAPVRTTTTNADGTYSFEGLPTGKYLVQEVSPSGYVRTAPALTDYYAVNASGADTTYGSFDFANAEKCDLSDFSNVYFIINGCTKVYDLRGNTHQGDTITAYFKYTGTEANHPVTFVSYYAPTSSFDANNAYLQQIEESKTVIAQPGKSYSITITAPDCYYQVDLVCGYAIDTFGPAGSNIFYSAQTRLISADNGGTQACFCGTSTISGTVFKDLNNDGDIDANEAGIKNVKVVLTGYNDLGQYVVATDYTDDDGFYQFTGLRDGTYKVTETQPTDYLDGKDSLGSLGGTLGNDVFSNITIAGGNQDGINYNFGEISKTTCSTTLNGGMTATIGFWQNKNGQCLIKAMNGSANSTKLGNWLATNFPNLFGNTSGNTINLSGKTNSQVADAFIKTFNCKGTKTRAQVFATALAVYVTDSDLAGGTYAKSYGFTVNSNGTGAATFNVGENGSAIGLTNYKSYTITQILTAANKVDAFDTSSSTQTKVNNLFTSINEKGDI